MAHFDNFAVIYMIYFFIVRSESARKTSTSVSENVYWKSIKYNSTSDKSYAAENKLNLNISNYGKTEHNFNSSNHPEKLKFYTVIKKLLKIKFCNSRKTKTCWLVNML